MGATKEILIKMSEEEYLNIPDYLRHTYLSSKNITKQDNDWTENMRDEMFSKLYYNVRSAKKELEEREYQLRELRRKEKNK